MVKEMVSFRTTHHLPRPKAERLLLADPRPDLLDAMRREDVVPPHLGGTVDQALFLRDKDIGTSDGLQRLCGPQNSGIYEVPSAVTSRVEIGIFGSL